MKAFIGTVILIIILAAVYKNKHKKVTSSSGDQSTTSASEIAENVRKAIGFSFYIDTYAGEAEIEIENVYPYEGAIMVEYKVYEGDLELGKTFLKAAEKEIRSRARGHQGKYEIRTKCKEFNGEML